MNGCEPPHVTFNLKQNHTIYCRTPSGSPLSPELPPPGAPSQPPLGEISLTRYGQEGGVIMVSTMGLF